jgi:hypothetical protein
MKAGRLKDGTPIRLDSPIFSHNLTKASTVPAVVGGIIDSAISTAVGAVIARK